MRRTTTALVILAVITLVHPAPAEENPRTPGIERVTDATRTSVFVSHAGTDAAGTAFVAGLRSAVKSSSRYSLSESEADASLIVVIVSVSPQSNSRVASAVSLAYVANNEWRSLLGSAARFVGRERAESMGRATVDELTAVLAAYDPVAVR